MKEIVLTTINAKWIHPSLALRLLKANLASDMKRTLEDRCEIVEFNLRQPLAEKIAPLLAARPKILGISVSIWNHLAVAELLGELERAWAAQTGENVKPVIVLGGPEVSYLPPDAEIFKYADYVIRGEGEVAFRELCEKILADGRKPEQKTKTPQFIRAEPVRLDEIKSGYHFYTDEDIAKKLIYVEASRGCPFNCEFCLSAADDSGAVREFPLDRLLSEMDELVQRGARTFKFLDRTFNLNIKRAIKICEFFLEKIESRKTAVNGKPLVVHFEMVPSLFPRELLAALTRFPPETLRLEIGIQTLNAETAARIGRSSNAEKELETLRFLREKTSAIIHADLIAGLPGETLASFGEGFDRLWLALSDANGNSEIQLGILKLLPGALIVRHSETFGMRYNPLPPYEIEETSAMSASDLRRVKNFARFWEILVNRGLVSFERGKPVFESFMALSDSLLAHFGRNWGIDKHELVKIVMDYRSFLY